MFSIVRKERLRSVSATGATPYSNSATYLADVARLAFCLSMLPMWASFRKKMIEDAMSPLFLQQKNADWENNFELLILNYRDQ